MTKFLNRTEKEIKSRINHELESISGAEKGAVDRAWERVSQSGATRSVSSGTASAVAVMLASVAATFLIMLAPAQTVKMPEGSRVVISGPGFGPVIAPDPLPVVGTQKRMRVLLAASIESGMFDPARRSGQGDTIPHGGFDVRGDKLLGAKGDFRGRKEAAALDYNPNYSGLEAPVPFVGSQKNADVGVSANGAFSQTNVQVEGVDEGDVVKTDGKHIYRVRGNRILVIEATSSGTMRIAATIEREGPTGELYIDGDRLIAVGPPDGYRPDRYSMIDDRILPANADGYASPTTSIEVYDLSDLTKVQSVRKLDFPGNSISSRKIGDKLYLVTSSNVEAQSKGTSPDAVTFSQPRYRDSLIGKEQIDIPLDDVSYIPGKEQAPQYIMVAAIDVRGEQKNAEITTFLGEGSMLYASQGNLYVSRASGVSTDVYRFTLSEGKAIYSGKGQFAGTLLNQYSMDEYDGHLRVATTKDTEDGPSNSVFVMDKELKISGKLEVVAPGERIYSARFMGERAYLVTFRETDPFFAIDLRDPESPKLLGELKLPGVSEYLHPYDKDHIIGIGRGSEGEGVKISMFDVSDVAHPVESSKAVIGRSGSLTEVTSNPKALLFSAERNLLALPALVIGDNGGTTFKGLYVYRVDDKGFKYRGRISHTPAEWPRGGYGNSIDRAMYIEDMLYSFSESLIKQNRLDDLSEVSTLSLP